MKKKLLVFCILMALLVSGTVLHMTAGATVERYQVGYAMRDINPWVDPADHSKGVLPVELSGNGNNWERACTGFMDDNDDGVVGEGDGLFTTATAVTDPYGKTVIYITIDSLQGYSAVTNDARAAIVAALGSDVIAADQIMVNGNHTHSGPTFSSMKTSSNPAFNAYYAYTVAQITDAAVEAYHDRAEAVMKKGAIDARESTAYLGYNNAEGYHMNAIRHYDVVSEHKTVSFMQKQHVAGSNFGGMTTTMKDYKQISRTNALESDNTMYVLLFEFPDNGEKDPVVFVNWRAHSTGNSGIAKTKVSADYANSVRANLRRAGYRPAFFQGASGNVVTTSTVVKDWEAECSNGRDLNVYGRILADVVLDCIERKMTDELPAGKIRTLQMTYHGQLQTDSEGLLAAARAYQAASAALGENKAVTCPYAYTHTDGKTYFINSKFHASSVITRSTASAAYTDLELNAIIMGDNVAFVTAPNEMADRYDLAGSTADEDNDWLELIDEATYGTPFVLGYTNDGRGYIPFSLEYVYNTYEYFRITGKGANGSEFHGAGSYEANTSRFARGTGEDIIQTFKWMLHSMDEVRYTARCEACQEEVEWKPIFGSASTGLNMGTGHYYLLGDMPKSALGSNRFSIKAGQRLCLDLNGYKMETQSRSFYIEGSGATLNLMDRKGTGQVISYSGGNNVSGGTVYMGSSTTLNMYGGTMQFIRQELAPGKYETGNGAVVSCAGTINMYGGTLIGGELEKSSYYSPSSANNGCGGTVYVSGKLNAYGGRIIAGKTGEGGRGNCVYLVDTGDRITLSGDALIDEIYINDNSGAQLIVSGAYTGKAAIRFNPEKDSFWVGADIGKNDNAQFTSDNLYCTSHPQYAIGAFGSNMVMAQWDEAACAVVSVPSGNRTFATLSEALSAYETGTVVLLRQTDENVTVRDDAYLDLNGCDITGKVTVAAGKTLYCMDSQTDDYTVADGIYGKLHNVSGTVAAVPADADCATDGYLMVTQADGISFHRVNLRLKSVALRAETVGIYYKSAFASDEVVASMVDKFGVALSVTETPDAQNVETKNCICSWFTGFTAGSNGNGGDLAPTLLTGIMKLTNTDAVNEANARLPVYGRAYLRLSDGQYLFGEPACRSLQEQVELVNGMWNDTSFTAAKKKAVISMYRAYPEIVSTWNVPRITTSVQQESKASLTDGATLRILTISDRSGLDTTEYLYDIAVAEGCTDVVVGRLFAEEATLQTHLTIAQSGGKGYTYTKNNSGTWSAPRNASMAEGLRDENWDIILIQQSDAQSPVAESYGENIYCLTRYINRFKTNPDARFVWNMPWAFRSGSTHPVFANTFGGDQNRMYEGIVSVVQENVLPLSQITKIIPTGTAIQNVRASVIGDALTEDDRHLNDLGKLIAGYTLYAALRRDMTTAAKQAETTLTQVNLEHSELTQEYKQILLHAVNAAIDAPFAVSR